MNPTIEHSYQRPWFHADKCMDRRDTVAYFEHRCPTIQVLGLGVAIHARHRYTDILNFLFTLRCPTPTKKAYHNGEMAKVAAQRLNHGTDGHRFTTYLCKCGKWHLTDGAKRLAAQKEAKERHRQNEENTKPRICKSCEVPMIRSYMPKEQGSDVKIVLWTCPQCDHQFNPRRRKRKRGGSTK